MLCGKQHTDNSKLMLSTRVRWKTGVQVLDGNLTQDFMFLNSDGVGECSLSELPGSELFQNLEVVQSLEYLQMYDMFGGWNPFLNTDLSFMCFRTHPEGDFIYFWYTYAWAVTPPMGSGVEFPICDLILACQKFQILEWLDFGFSFSGLHNLQLQKHMFCTRPGIAIKETDSRQSGFSQEHLHASLFIKCLKFQNVVLHQNSGVMWGCVFEDEKNLPGCRREPSNIVSHTEHHHIVTFFENVFLPSKPEKYLDRWVRSGSVGRGSFT